MNNPGDVFRFVATMFIVGIIGYANETLLAESLKYESINTHK
jgi:hypothetical protein